ncbi:MAG: hypothetical protein ACLTSG_08185 [Lachnospiraceae bacterium]
MFQNPDNQIVANVVEDDVAFAPENLGVEPAEIRRRVDGALRTVGMYEYPPRTRRTCSEHTARGHSRRPRRSCRLRRARSTVSTAMPRPRAGARSSPR